MTHAEALYPGLFEKACAMAREGVTRIAATEFASEACAAAANAMAGNPDAFAGEEALEHRVKREVRARVLADHRPRRRRKDREVKHARLGELPVFGWIADPLAPHVAWEMNRTIDDAMFEMPKLRRDTLLRVREDSFSFAAVAEERGPSVEGVTRNLAHALADLRGAARDGRKRAHERVEHPDPDLVLFGKWLASELAADKERAMEERFLDDDAFYAKTAPVMQIWTLPTGFGGADEVEKEGLTRVDPDIGLITDYLGRELPARDVLEVERRLETDVAFFVKVQPIIEIWRMPVNFRELLKCFEGEAPEPEVRAAAMGREEEAAEQEEDPDLSVISAWLHNRLPEHHDEAVSQRLKEDEAFFEKVWPVVRVWRTRSNLLRRLGDTIGDEPVDPSDADVALITDYLALALPPLVCGTVETRLKRDDAFARKVAPLVKAWRMPRRVG